MLSGRSQSSWIQLRVFNSELATSNHLKKKKKFFSSDFWSLSHICDITPLLCAKLVTALLSLMLTFIVHSGEFIFTLIHFLQPLLYEIIDFQSCQRSRTLSSSVLAETQIQKSC